ncbi:MAG: CehA/McbA family metallohydrolase [Candidatus Dormibacteraeota bacterium]|nr:CehA/McbA family metallohydrolase [Candidatus Dormibacteraeota bacterium]MBO0761299.1 CehA/McbA family metallohydrolase [Candidatus Dormibacteraeota bacterium]
MGLADLHCHTTASDGVSPPRAMLEAGRRRGLAVVAITDHNTLRGALAARELAARDPSLPRVVVGAEMTTRHGHVVGLFLEEPIPRWRPARETVERIHEQGGLAVAVHPCWRPGRHGVGRELLELGGFDAVEVRNGAPAPSMWRANRRAARLERDVQLPVTGGSDAHGRLGVGWALTEFAGSTPDDLRRELEAGRTRARGRVPAPWALAGYVVSVAARHPWLLRNPF